MRSYLPSPISRRNRPLFSSSAIRDTIPSSAIENLGNSLLDFHFSTTYDVSCRISKTQQLQAKVVTLPENIAAEVLDFLEFVAAKRVHEQTQDAARKVRAKLRTIAIPPGKLPTFKGGPILAGPREMKEILYASHESPRHQYP
jgi:hypothetical protein